MADLSKSMWNLALQPLKTSYLQYSNTYDHQPRQGGDLLWGTSVHKVTWHFDHLVLEDHATN